MANLFHAYRVRTPDTKIHAYFIESTAPDNIDDPEKLQDPLPDSVIVDADQAIDEIATTLRNSDNPTLVLSIHGFNNPREVILPGFYESFNIVINDAKLNQHDVVCIGYRWPSERIFSPAGSVFHASPTSLRIVFILGIMLGILTIDSLWYWYSEGSIEHGITWAIFVASVLFFWIPFALILLRIVVYFRDGYRANSNGVPELVEIIRQIDKKLDDAKIQKRVQLSFIGHSMGAYVVTSAVRILSDVFDPASMRSGLNSTSATPTSDIGHAFRLARLVLVSPDIPAEALLSTRANFLSASLGRFEEAFLFSNEGDEVLRQISTTANYFSFPTRRNKFGYRLGNVCILGLPYGISNSFNIQFLQVGNETLGNLYNELNSMANKQLQEDLPKTFSYFDCTDCVENKNGGFENGKGVLTLARRGRPKKMKPYDHFMLLILYLILPRKYDVHGGYFRSKFLSKLIYRLACIGYKSTEEAYDGKLHLECQQRQIRALLKS